MTSIILVLIEEAENEFNNLPEDIAEEYSNQYDKFIELADKLENALANLNKSFKKAGYPKIGME